jgi:hypothetical protein
MGGRGDLVYGAIERCFVLLRRVRGPAQLADELERRGPDLVFRGRGLEVGERLDIAAHDGPSRRFEDDCLDVIIVSGTSIFANDENLT